MYDENKAQRAIRFCEKLKHTKGRFDNAPFLLEPFQKRIISDVFGTVLDSGARQYRTVYVEIPRKNGKSELAAALALKLLFADDEPGAEIYGAAADRDQASIVFDVAVQMVRKAPGLAKRAKIVESTKRILYPARNSFYRVLSAEHASKHGFNPHAVVFDELHAQPNRHLWDVMTTGSGTRWQPLVVAITTAGYDRTSICWEQHEYAQQILDGVIEDPTFYPVIFAADREDDWTDEAIWYKANPALGVFRDLEEMRVAFHKAKNMPAFQNTFRRLYLNQWTQQEDRWMDLGVWDESAGEVYEEDLEGEIAYGGLDLASTEDMAAFVLVFPDEDECYDVLPFFWLPEDAVARRTQKDNVPYQVWADNGLLEVTPGNIIDYRYILNRISELGERYYIQEIAFDRWGAQKIANELADAGFTVAQFGQGFATMASPTKELMRLIKGRRLRHGGHPILRWQADNLVVRQDPSGNLKPDKGKSSEKIDGMVALIMGLDRALRNQASVYEDRGLTIL